MESEINSSLTAWALENNSDLRSVYKIKSKSACDSLSITLQKRYLRSSKGLFSNLTVSIHRGATPLHDVLKVKSSCNTALPHIHVQT